MELLVIHTHEIHQQVFPHHRAEGFEDRVPVQEDKYENRNDPKARPPPARPAHPCLHVIVVLSCLHDD